MDVININNKQTVKESHSVFSFLKYIHSVCPDVTFHIELDKESRQRAFLIYVFVFLFIYLLLIYLPSVRLHHLLHHLA